MLYLMLNSVTCFLKFSGKDDTTSDTSDIAKTAGISASFVAVIIVGIIYHRRRQNRELHRNARHERYGTTVSQCYLMRSSLAIPRSSISLHQGL